MKLPRALVAALALAAASASTAACTHDLGQFFSRAGTPYVRPSREVAAREFDAAVAAYARGENARALAHFERAYDNAPTAAVLYNIARVHDTMGHDAQAARYYVAYVRAQREVSADQRQEIDEALARIYPRVAWLVVRGSTVVTVDDDRVSALLAGAPIAVNPGIRMIRVDNRAPLAVRLGAGDRLLIDSRRPDALVVAFGGGSDDLRSEQLVQVSATSRGL